MSTERWIRLIAGIFRGPDPPDGFWGTPQVDASA